MKETISARASRTLSISVYSENRRHVKIDLTDLAQPAVLSFRRDYIIGSAEGYAAIIRVFGGFIVGDAVELVARITSDVKQKYGSREV